MLTNSFAYVKAAFMGNQVFLLVLVLWGGGEETDKSTSVALDLLYLQLLYNWSFFIIMS